MSEKNTESDVVTAPDKEGNLPENSVESMNCKEEEFPTETKNDVNNGVEVIIEGKTCDNQVEEDSNDKEDIRKNEVVEEIPRSDARPQEVLEQDQVNKDVKQLNETKEGEMKEVVAQEGENKEKVEQDNESKEVVPQEVARQDDRGNQTLGEIKEPEDLPASENLVRAAAEDESQKEEMSGGSENKELEGNNEVKEGSKNIDAIDKEKNEMDQEHKGETSDTESMEVERNSEEKGVAVKNNLETDPVEGELKGPSNDEDKEDEYKGSKKRKRGRNAVDKTKGDKKDEQGEKTPGSSISSRPVRERKTVERLVASIEKDVIREIFVEKGSGVALKDIPNVAYKLSKKKNDEIFKQLHTILFGRRGKAIQMKSHVSRFSGFVWHGDEEKCKMKVREKFDKLVKEKLIEFCDVLDIPITNKVTTKKEEVVTKIMEFLAAPHPTTDTLLPEKEQSEKTTKRKRFGGQGSPTLGSTKGSRKRRKKSSENSEKKGESGADRETDKEKDEAVAGNQENGNGKQDQSEDESAGKKLSGSEDAMKEDAMHSKQRPKNASAKVESSAKKKTQQEILKKPDLNDSEKEEDADNPKQSLKKSSGKKGSNRTNTKKSNTSSKVGLTSKVMSDSDSDGKALNSKDATKKKKQVKDVKEKITATPEPSIKKKNVKTDPKGKPKEERLKPSDKVLRNQICQILKEVDFNTATFTDILKLLGKHFKTDLTPRKASIKLMIQEELTKMADAADDEEEEQDVKAEPAKVNA